MENATLHAPQPDTEPSDGETDDDELDEYSKGIAEFVVTWCNEKLVPRDARIAKLETQVEMLIALLGQKSGSFERGSKPESDIIDLPRFMRRRTDAA